MILPPTGDRMQASGPQSTSVKDGDLRTPMPVGDFMSQLGLVMRLPKKTCAKAPSPAQTAKRRVLRTRLWIPVVAATSGILFAASQLRPAAHVELPSNIVGAWQTTDPRYAGRQLLLSGTTISETDSGGILGTLEPISELSVRSYGDTTAAAIQHHADGQFATLYLVYVSSPEEYITLRNPGGVRWTRVRETDEPVAYARAPGLTPPPVPPGKKAWEH